MKITEMQLDIFAESTVDESGVVSNVAVTGFDSRNGYRYAEAAMQQAVPLYEGTHVFLDHRIGEERNRSVRELAGYLRNPRLEVDKIRADVHTLNTEAGNHFRAVAQSQAPRVGMSHVVEGRMSQDRKIVEEIRSVISADLVINPATNSNLTEQEIPMDLATLKQSHPELVEALRCEMAAPLTESIKGTLQTEFAAKETAIQEATLKAERARVFELHALCTTANLAEQFLPLMEAGTSPDKASATLLQALVQKAPPPTADPRTPLEEKDDPDKRFKQEYREAAAVLTSQGITEASYVRSRRISEGLDTLPTMVSPA